ncbi:MAG: DnaD domain protein [Oscillospiraceae bacterium]|nr:DnaD domain protein [Oscillospiraceae bacterium]
MMSESVTISQADLRKLLSAANPDGALLYLYLQSGKPLETAEKELNMNGSRVCCAAAVLRQLGLLPEERPARIAPGERPAYTDEDVYKTMDYDTDFRGLYEEVQRLLGRSLNTEEIKILLGFVRYLGLDYDVISILVSYCKARAEKKGRKRRLGLLTIEQEAYAWAEKGIDTLEEAAAFIQMQNLRESKIGKLQQMLQIYGRNLTAAETRYANAWLDMGMDEEAISMAYERTCLNTGGLNWAYMNKILQRWHSQGLHTAEEIRTGDQKPGTGANGQRQLDADEVAAIRKMMEGN